MLGKLRYLTAGESHGQALTCIIDGVPSNLALSADDINIDLARRQKGFGRGGRMKIETDRAQILSGVRHGKTLGSPVSLLIENKDWANWETIMSPDTPPSPPLAKGGVVTRPRPGHADLAGALKYSHRDLRNILERSSARETAARVAAGAVAKKFLSEFDIRVISYVTEIGGIRQSTDSRSQNTDYKTLLSNFKKAEASLVRCLDEKTEEKMITRIKTALKKGDTLGGVFEVAVLGVPAGLGSYSQWDRKLEARLSYAMMGIQAIKGVEIGLGFEMAGMAGSEVMDEIFYRTKKATTPLAKGGEGGGSGDFYRKTNNAGGIEGGMSNGMPVIVRAAMKPIPTLKTPLSSIDINTKKKFKAAYERSDTCAVPAASVIGEAVTALVIADSFLDKFGGDSMEEIKRNYSGYLKQIQEF
ncbi:MAG: chorismate synthase [Nitrospiraceae bacterium]|nr:MAG: chorismate synthase [Nitrospiraceae bacterium]